METGSITGAAARLQTAKSSVSDALRTLETRLGVRLLDRTTRHVRPTPAGQQFYLRCRRLLDDAGAALAEARGFQSAPAGRLRVAAPEGFAERFVVPGLGAFVAAFPQVDVQLVSGARHVGLVEEAFDLAIRIAEALSPTLVMRRIGSQRVIVVAAPGYLNAHGTPETPADVVRHICVATSPPLPWHAAWPLGPEPVAVRPRLTLNTAEALRAAAIAGVGLAPVPDWAVADAVAAGLLTHVLAGIDTPVSGIFAAYPTNRLLTPVVRAFVDHLTRELRARGVPP